MRRLQASAALAIATLTLACGSSTSSSDTNESNDSSTSALDGSSGSSGAGSNDGSTSNEDGAPGAPDGSSGSSDAGSGEGSTGNGDGATGALDGSSGSNDAGSSEGSIGNGDGSTDDSSTVDSATAGDGAVDAANDSAPGAEAGTEAGCAPPMTLCSGTCVNTQTDPSNCNACAHVCPTSHDIPVCTGGACVIASCDTGFMDCDGSSLNGCEIWTAGDVNNCGACNAACTATANSVSGCNSGSCVIASCNAGFEDCDGLRANGCESDINNDANNCGSCGAQCSVGQICQTGHCTDLCPSGQTFCTTNNGSGSYCVDITSDPTNCGGCGTLCPSQTVCSGSACSGGPIDSYWFEDGTGTSTYADHGSANNVLAISTAAPAQVAGYSGKGLLFNNTSTTTMEYLSQGAPTSLPLGTTARTLEAWVQPGALNGPSNDTTYNGILAYGADSTCQQAQMLSMTSAFRVSSANWCNDLIESNTGAAGAKGAWSHVAYTWDGSKRVLYLNGVQVATDNPPAFNTVSGVLRVGTVDEPGRLFNGVIDEARIYGYARTAAQMLDDATLVARYWFDASDGTDVGPNHITATPSGVTFVTGHIGKAASFDGGTSTSVTIPSLTLLGSSSGPFSIEMWVNMPAAASSDLFDVHAASGWCTPFLGTDSSGHPTAQIWGGSSSKGVTASTPITTNTWVHLAQTWSAANGLRLYVNGTLAASDATLVVYSPSGGVDTGVLGNFAISGCSSSTVPSAAYKGLMDSVQIYGRERTSAEISYDASH